MLPYLSSRTFRLHLAILALLSLTACKQGPDCPDFLDGQLWVDTPNGRVTEKSNALYAYQEQTGYDVMQFQLLDEGDFSFAMSLLSEGRNTLGLGIYAPDSSGTAGSLTSVAVVNGEDSYFAAAGQTRITFLDWECREVSAFFDLKMVNYKNAQDTLVLGGALQGALVLIQDETE